MTVFMVCLGWALAFVMSYVVNTAIVEAGWHWLWMPFVTLCISVAIIPLMAKIGSNIDKEQR